MTYVTVTLSFLFPNHHHLPITSLTMALAIAASGEEAIQRTLDVSADTTASNLSESDFDAFYEIQSTAAEILGRDYKRVRCSFSGEELF